MPFGVETTLLEWKQPFWSGNEPLAIAGRTKYWNLIPKIIAHAIHVVIALLRTIAYCVRTLEEQYTRKKHLM